MPTFRFNHMELTLPEGALDQKMRDEIRAFYGEIFGFDAMDIPILGQLGLLLMTDPQASQFLLVTEQPQHMVSPGYDHLGFLYDTRAEVDDKLAKVKAWQARDARVQIKEYEDLVVGDVTTHAFYVKHLLPIWFDVQAIEMPDTGAPRWRYGD